jgi:hypothetical protein
VLAFPVDHSISKLVPFPQPSLLRRLRRHIDALVSASEALAIGALVFLARKVLR